jgi:4-hydroxy-tetrahydrodipicolinate synthase
MVTKTFEGIFPYLVTPLDESYHLKEDVLAQLVEHLIGRGIHGVTPLGSNGEAPYLNWDTKKRVIETVVQTVSKRIPVIGGVCNISTPAAVYEAIETEKLGVDGILIMMPSYFPLDNQQVIGHFRAVAHAVSCPVVLYTNPKFQTWDFSIESLKELIEEPNIQYLKDASGNIGKLMSIVTTFGNRLKIFSSTASIPLFTFLIGGVGWMSGPACIIPTQSIDLYEAAKHKRWEEAVTIQEKILPIHVAFQKYSLAAAIKAGLKMQGFAVGDPIPPQKQLSSEELKSLEKMLRDIGAL